MAGKEATVFILDVNPSMRQATNDEGKTYHQMAHEALFQILHSKLIAGRKTDQVTLLLVGTEGTDNILAEPDQYRRITAYTFPEDESALMRMADLQLLRYVANETENGTGDGDVFEGIIIAIKTLQDHCRHLKYIKKIYLFTDGVSPLNSEGFEDVVNQVKEMDIAFTLVGYGFESPLNSTSGSSDPQRHIQDLEAFTESVSGFVFSGDEAHSLLTQLRSKSVKPVTVFRGNLTLGDVEQQPTKAVSISIHAYNKTSEMKLPSAKKWSSVAEGMSDMRGDPAFGTVGMEREYHAAEDDVMNNDGTTGTTGAGPSDHGEGDEGTVRRKGLQNSELVRAYRYGKTLVPFTAEDEEAMKLRTQKGMSILGFLPQSRVPRHYLMSNVLILTPEPGNHEAEYYFSSLMAALEEGKGEHKFAALVRYCRVDDANPKLGVVIPGEAGFGFWCQIPFSEDIRSYTFPNLSFLVESSAVQQHETIHPQAAPMSSTFQTFTTAPATISLSNTTGAGSTPSISTSSSGRKRKMDVRQKDADETIHAVDEFIDSMDLMTAVRSTDEDGNEVQKEAYDPMDVFNPGWQRLYQCIADRAVFPDKAGLPPMNPMIVQCMDLNPAVVEASRPAAQRFEAAFAVSKVEKVKKTAKNAWALNDNPQTTMTAEGLLGLNGDAGVEDVKSEEDEDVALDLRKITAERVTKVSSEKPVEDFLAMVGGEEDLVTEAVAQLSSLITTFVTTSYHTQFYEKALDCLRTLRKTCLTEDEVSTYNDWLRQFKSRILPERHDFWETVKKEALGLITAVEVEAIPRVGEKEGVSVEEAAEFLSGDKTPGPVVESDEIMDADDLLDEMD
ncbi:SPOC like C-terminal domain-containing protein [Gaertneriomyces semiglobifer]|nr:SPOC like C-terminal domain-containing protein [Gaertneriomyces semiglobifer]